MKLNDSASWGWFTAGICLGLLGLEGVRESGFWGGVLPVIGAVWCGCRSGADEERSALVEALCLSHEPSARALHQALHARLCR